MAWNKIGLCLVLLGGVLLYGALSFGLPKNVEMKMPEPGPEMSCLSRRQERLL